MPFAYNKEKRKYDYFLVYAIFGVYILQLQTSYGGLLKAESDIL